MGFIYFIILLIVIYQMYKTWKKKQPGNIIERLEILASKDFQKAKAWLEKDIKRMAGDEKYIQGRYKELDGLGEMKDNYFRLKEKYRHDLKLRMTIAQDWSEYIFTIDNMHSNFDILDSTGQMDRDEVRQDFIRKEEIEKRFNSLLLS